MIRLSTSYSRLRPVVETPGAMSDRPGGYVARAVLESDGTLIRRVRSHRLEGSRFGLRPATLANFASALGPPKRRKATERLRGRQAAPGNVSTVSQACSGFHNESESGANRRVETFAGAACCHILYSDQRHKRMSRGHWGNRTSHRRATPFRDDEDEYDREVSLLQEPVE